MTKSLVVPTLIQTWLFSCLDLCDACRGASRRFVGRCFARELVNSILSARRNVHEVTSLSPPFALQLAALCNSCCRCFSRFASSSASSKTCCSCVFSAGNSRGVSSNPSKLRGGKKQNRRRPGNNQILQRELHLDFISDNVFGGRGKKKVDLMSFRVFCLKIRT